MTREIELTALERKIVVIFDICSSTKILEDLKQTDNMRTWRNFLVRIKEYLCASREALHFEIYKFVGDGWILLFPQRTNLNDFCKFLTDLCTLFDLEFDARISGLLQHSLAPIGLSFGIDEGDLIRLEMNEQIEYIGRAINVAARLQAATKSDGKPPNYRVMISRPALASLGSVKAMNLKFTLTTHSLTLRNVSNGERYECYGFHVL